MKLHSEISDLRSLQVEGLGVVTQQHHVLLQVCHSPVLMVSHSLLLTEELQLILHSTKVIFHNVFPYCHFAVPPSGQQSILSAEFLAVFPHGYSTFVFSNNT